MQAFFTNLTNLFNKYIAQISAYVNKLQVNLNVSVLANIEFTNTFKRVNARFDQINANIANA